MFKEPPRLAKVERDPLTDVLYDNGFKQHIPVESLIFRYGQAGFFQQTVVQA